MRVAWLALLLMACSGEESAQAGQPSASVRLIYQGEGYRIELRDESYTWNEERSARSLSAEVWLTMDAALPAELRPTMLYGRLFLDVDISGEWSDIDGGTAGILDDSLREAFAVVPAEGNELKLGPLIRTGVRPIDPPAWRGAVKLPDGSVVGASIPAEAIDAQ